MNNVISQKISTVIQNFNKVKSLYKSPLMYYLLTFSILKKGTYRIELKDGNSFLIRAKEQDIHMLNDIYFFNEYNWYIEKIGKQKNIVEIGSNIGALSIKLSRSTKKLYCFEPDKHSFEILKRNCSLNSSTNITIFNEGIAAKRGKYTLFNNGRGSGGNSLYPRSKGIIEKSTINCITLDDLVKRIGEEIDSIFMDCEGAEFEVLMKTQSKTFKKIKNLILEYHDNLSFYNHLDLLKVLKQNDFSVQLINKENDKGFIIATHE